jgi:CBS domain-containing protein
VRGIITDRDIVIRAVAEHKNPETTMVRDAMSNIIASCYEDQSAEAIAKVMEENQVRRLPVIDKNNRLIGIVSLGDIATRNRNKNLSGEILESVSETRTRMVA